MAGNLPPGYAVVGAGEAQLADAGPAPVGLFRGAPNQWNGSRGAAMPPRTSAAPYDAAVQTTSILPAQTALDTQSHSRPHVISHLFGFGGLRQRRIEAREEREKSVHAAIAYDDPSRPVNELPASVVYGPGH